MIGVEYLINVAEADPVAVGVKEALPIEERRAKTRSDLHFLPVVYVSKPNPGMTEMARNKQGRPLVRCRKKHDIKGT